MSSTSDTEVCLRCGEEYWYSFDLETGECTKTSACKCDRKIMFIEWFLEDRGLFKTFDKEFKESEQEYLKKKMAEEQLPIVV